MADKLTVNTNIALSKLPETTINDIADLAAEFDGAVTSGYNITLPNVEKIISENLVGTGDEFPLTSDNDYFSHPSITFSDRVNTTQFARLLARFMSGTSTPVAVGATDAFDHTLQQQASTADPQLKSSTVAAKMGGLDLIMGGMVANSLQVGFTAPAQPTYSVEMIGSGKLEYMADQTPALVLPAPVAQDYMGSIAAIALTLNDGTSFDLSAAGRVQAFNIQASNNVITGDRRPGDPFQTGGNPDSGAFTNRMTRGVRTVSASLSIYCDDNKREWLDHLNNTTITALVFKMVGRIADDTSRHEVEFTIPKAIFRTVSVTDNNGKLLYNIEIVPLKDASIAGLFSARIRNLMTTLA
jgi:Phage tail tube protein